MAWAKETTIGNLIEVEICDHTDCTCGAGLTSQPDYLDVRSENGQTTLYATVAAGIEIPIPVPGAPRKSNITEAFNNCPGPVELSSGEIVCGAIARLRKQV